MRQGKKTSADFVESETIELKQDYSESIRKDTLDLKDDWSRMNF